MAHRRFEGKEHAASYLRYRVSPPQELIAEILAFLENMKGRPFDLAVDVGCGSGQGTLLLAPHFTQVIGTDISPAQLEVALANSSAPNIFYRQCPAEELPFADGEVDLVTSMTAAHWFHRPRFLQEADRLLKPRGCLALVSYTLDMDLEYGQHSHTLTDICHQFYKNLLPFRSAHIGTTTVPLYKQMYDSCPYPDKEWHECLRMRRPMPLSGYIGMVETFSSYRALLKHDPVEAHRFSQDFRNRPRLLSEMGESNPDTEITVVIKYFYWLACKPAAA
uniref:putative methyltransferase DDB_G0268948 isoform X1 n=1 Tax=Oncorhynchus gorbuscha TaxID=8017 RepID=UPI001EAF4CCC|nr:putative methyltransferase DDB_G0268948 isoform X1 [Oncorhynchus gorbuscha]